MNVTARGNNNRYGIVAIICRGQCLRVTLNHDSGADMAASQKGRRYRR